MEVELQPIDILLDLVIKEELNPWDIDIIEITDKYVERINQMKELDLSIPGRVLLSTSILLRIKSDILVLEQSRDEEEEYEEQIFHDFDESEYTYEKKSKREDINIPSFLPITREHKRRVTLFELVDALELALNEVEIKKQHPKKKRKTEVKIELDERLVREQITDVYERITSLTNNGPIKFKDLLLNNDREEIVSLLLIILYLSQKEKIYIWQDTLFGDIFIKRLG
ncbi:MAG: segregation/condensation protein A [Candidatus Hydrothermarchaeota archaeon]